MQLICYNYSRVGYRGHDLGFLAEANSEESSVMETTRINKAKDCFGKLINLDYTLSIVGCIIGDAVSNCYAASDNETKWT